MGYERYLQVLAKLDRPRTWWPVLSLAIEMRRDRRLVSAYMTRLHKMGLVTRRLYRGAGRGRPGYAYRLSRRGREHARWLREVYARETEFKMLELIGPFARATTWTPDFDAEVRRFLRRQEKESDRQFWKTMLSVKRSNVLQDPMSLFEYDQEPRKPRGRSRSQG